MNPGIVVKVALTPLLVGSATWAGRRWGDAVGGWLVGLPLTSGPIVLTLGLERGSDFASAAATGALAGSLSQTSFAYAYSAVAVRAGPAPSLVLASGAFLASTALLREIPASLPVAGGVAVAALLAALAFMPRGTGARPPTLAPRWDVVLRMVMATALVLLITGAAPLLGPRLSGLLAPFPLFAATLAAFAHSSGGGGAARDVLRGLLFGLFSFCAFFAVASATIHPLGLITALAVSTAAAIAVQAATLSILRRAN